MNMNTDFPQPSDRIAYYGRVSTPKQKLEQQREHVLRFCEAKNLNLLPEMMFEDKEKRHKSAKRQEFQRLLALCRAGKVDWIIIATFDRWGVADVDEFMEFRRELMKTETQLWSVVDSLNLTGCDDGDYYRIISLACAATRMMAMQAEKNILKMIEMAKNGWAATGNGPFGLDLVCYPVNDITRPLFRVVRLRFRPHLFKILWYTSDSRVVRDNNGIITASNIRTEKEETVNNMPPRDKKATGYRYEPTIMENRLKAVRLMFELYDEGMTFANISENLWKQGYGHYDKPFGYHGVEVILSNSAYIGLPAWGKLGVGAYRVCLDKQPTQYKRKKDDTIVLKKTEDQFIYPSHPLFNPVVPQDQFERVKKRLQGRGHVNEQYGKRRTRDKETHPLNGKLFCPDCNAPMVLGAFQPRVGQKKRCFVCGTYRKTIRTKCHANTVRWEMLDLATDELLAAVKDRIEMVEQGNVEELQQAAWLKMTELGQTITTIINEVEAKPRKLNGKSVYLFFGDQGHNMLLLAFDLYAKDAMENMQPLKEELADIERQLDTIADELAKGIPSQHVRNNLNNKMTKLEARKAELEPKLVPLTDKATAIIEQLTAIKETVVTANRLHRANLLGAFIEKVVPIFEIQEKCKDGKRRAYVRGFTFFPKEQASKVMPEAMKIGAIRTGTGSSPPRGRSSRGMWTN